MGLHKLTAGDGYTYLTRQVAVHDATDRGHQGLGDYYSEKGESPGRWWGDGLTGLGMEPGAEVTEAQMRNLFGEGRHPDAEGLEDAAIEAGATVKQAEKVSKLGHKYAIHEAASEFQREVARRFTDYNYDHDLHWRTPVPADVRAEIRTAVAEEMFTRQHGRAPLDDRERAGFLARATRQQTTAVAGYDLAFTPVKSVSVLWALADREVAAQIEEAHHAAVERTLAYLEREVLFTRRGRGGVQQVKASGLIAAMFTHRDARSGDPNLHTHVAVSNKVQDASGRWLSVDGRVLYKANVTLSEMYNTLIESELVARLGVQFAPRRADQHRPNDRERKRQVREIVGVDARLERAWSSRSAAIEGRRRELAVAFQAAHGRPPTPVESYALAQQATLETRQAKHAPRSEADQRAGWRAEAEQILGTDRAIKAMVAGALGRPCDRQDVTPAWVRDTATAVVERVQGDRATWQVWHLRAEAQRRARTAAIALNEVETAVERVVEQAIKTNCITFEDPDPLTAAGVSPTALTRSDGVSVYTVHGSRLYTSAAIIDAERRLLATAHKRGGRRITDIRVGIALAETAANGTTLNAAQAAMVRELATSGHRLQLTLAPAGTGKTTAMEVLARAWRDSGGTVIGLAPSAVAAQELRDAVGGTCETLSKLVWSLHPDHETPGWVEAIGPASLVIIDEAGMASTNELAAAVDFITGRGGSVRLVGDDRQLAAVGAGGVLRDIATTVGAVTLTEVRRFIHPDGSLNSAEAAATLAVRDGDTSALGFYADHGRIHVADLAGAADQAYRAWAADVAAGKQSLLLAPTRELVAELNTRARNDRLTAQPEAAGQHSVRLADGTLTSAGDTILTRRNDRRLRISATDWVKNGDRWTVIDTHADGSITAIHNTLRRKITLPKTYVEAGHVQLGYATTIHGAQGATVDTAHTVLAGEEDRSLLYVGLTRGRLENHLYLAVGDDGDPHNLIRPETLRPPTALDQLALILGRDGAPVSATTAAREATSVTAQLRDAAARYLDALTFGAEHTLGDAIMQRLEAAADGLIIDLTDSPAWPTLRSHLALQAMDGHDPVDLLRQAVAAGGLGNAADPAAVLDARIHDRIGTGARSGPLPWLPPIPAAMGKHSDWGTYLSARARRVVELAQELVATSAAWTTATAPDWAQPLLAPGDARLRAAIAVWRAVYDIPDTDLRPTGPRQIGAPGEHQTALNRAAREARPSYPYAQRGWYQSMPEAVRTDPWVTPLCQKLARLERAGLPVGTYLASALSSDQPLPDEHAAAALWWRLVSHLGPTALHGDTHTADLLQPDWLPALAELTTESQGLQASPAWPALVAAVDEACQRHDWSAPELLASAFHALPIELRSSEMCDALVLRIAVLTDPPDDPECTDAPAPEDLDSTPPDYDQATGPSWINEPSLPRLDEPTKDRTGSHAPEAVVVEQLGIPRARILELNEAALAYYADCYPRSWAPAYLRQRLGTDLTDRPDVSVGYAPPGPASLIRHLLATGVSIEELEAAGLAKRRDRGDWVDVFRDRVVMPIRDSDGATIGFVGRRNPTRTDDDYAGPKYLNTRTTDIFTKGEALFGLAENRNALDAGALPIIVEGPLDALAITLASNGAAIGIAPLGTSLTPAQIDLLRGCFRADPANVAVATDADAAGWKSAQVAYWNLSAAGADPTHLSLPHGLDPAQVLEQHGSAPLLRAITDRGPLADAMVDQQLASNPDWTNPATRLKLIRESGLIIAARPPATWSDAIDRVNRRLRLSPGVLHLEVVDHSQNRATDPAAYSRACITEIQDKSRKRLRWELGLPNPTPATHRAQNADLARRHSSPGPPSR